MKRVLLLVGALALAGVLVFTMTGSAQAHLTNAQNMMRGFSFKPPHQINNATVAITPSGGPPGTPIEVLATGFAPNSGVNIGFTNMVGINDNLLTSVTANDSGIVRTTLIVPNNLTMFLGEQWYVVAASPDNSVRQVSPPFIIAETATPSRTPELGFLIDNIDPTTTFVGLPGGWVSEVGYGQGWQFVWSSNSATEDEAYEYMRWHMDGMSPGRYEAFVYIPPIGATTGSARYWVHSSAGYTALYVDQYANRDTWVSLGTYWFGQEPNMDLFVSLSDVTGEPSGTTQVGFDAVLFVPRD